jgi:glutathione S-transferase
MLKIYGIPRSRAFRTLWMAKELGLEYENVAIDMGKGETRTPEYLAINPNGHIPAIDDDGFVLWESHAIVRYLAAKHGAGTLWPADLKQRADSDRWMDWAYTFQASLRAVFWGLIRTPAEKRDLKAIEEGKKRCGELLAIPDQALAHKPYFVGNSLTIGDIPLGCHVQLWMRLPIERPSHPNLERWFERLGSRAPFRKIVDLPLS